MLSLEQLQNLLSVGLEIERSGPIIANESKPSVVFFTDIGKIEKCLDLNVL